MPQQFDRPEINFGREISRMRRLSGITQDRLARATGVSPSHIGNVERGERTPTPSLVRALDEVLEADSRLKLLWEGLTNSGRPAWLDALSDLLRDAEAVFTYQIAAFPGLIQTEDYAEATILHSTPWMPPKDITSSVTDRIARAKRFASADHPSLWLVMDESVLTRRIGSPDIVHEQLTHVLDLMDKGRIMIQVVPMDAPEHPGLAGAFMVITSSLRPDVVYAESVRGGQLVDVPQEVGRYRMLYGALQAIAMTPQQSLRRIGDEIERLTGGN